MAGETFDGMVPPALDESQQQAANVQVSIGMPATTGPVLSPTASETLNRAVTYSLPGMAVGLVDTLGQSFGVFDKDTVQKTMTAISPDGFGDFYARNKTPLRTGGEIAAILLPGMAATKVLRGVQALREGGALGEALMNSTAMDVILGNSAKLSNTERAFADAAQKAVKSQGVFSGKTFALPELNALKQTYTKARLADAARQTIAVEIAYRTMFGDSQWLYPADYNFTDQLKWGAAGLAVGGGIEFAAARYGIRKIVQAAAAKSTAVSEYAADISKVTQAANDRGVAVTQAALLKNDLSNQANNAADATLRTNLTHDQTLLTRQISETVTNMARDTHPILNRTTLSDGQIGAVTKALTKDETSLLFASKLADVPESKPDFFGEIDSLQKSANRAYQKAVSNRDNLKPQQLAKAVADAQGQLNTANAAAAEIHYVIEGDGSITPYKVRANNWLDQNSFDAIKRAGVMQQDVTSTGPKMVRHQTYFIQDSPIKLHDNLVPEMPANATPSQWSQLYAMTSKFIRDWKPVEAQRFPVNENMSRFTLEATMALADAHPEVNNLIDYGGKFTSKKDVLFDIADKKYQEFQTLMDRTERKPASVVGQAIFDRTKLDPSEVLHQLNLPGYLTSQTPHPLIETFAQGRMQGSKSLYDMFGEPGQFYNRTDGTHIGDLLQANMRETLGTTDPKQLFSLDAGLLKQQGIKPVFVASKTAPPVSIADVNMRALVETQANMHLQRLASINPVDAPLVRKTFDNVTSTSALLKAKDVQSLNEGVLSGAGIVVAQDRINEQIPALKALSGVIQDSDKVINQHIADLVSTHLIPTAAEIRAPKNKADLFDFNRIEQSYRWGWDIKSVEKMDNGRFGFVLDDTPRNKTLIDNHFGNGVDPEEVHYMPDMSIAARKGGYMPLSVSELAANTATTISDLSRQSGVEVNALRHATGRNVIKLRDFHLPTPELSNDGAWFVRQPDNKVIAAFSDGTNSQNRARALDAARKLQETTGNMHTAVSVDDVRLAHSMMEDDPFDVIDYSRQLSKTGAPITGGLAQTEIDTGPETLKRMINSLEQQYLSIGVRTRAAVFDPQLNYARQASTMLGADAMKNYNVFDRYQAMVLGRSVVSPNSPLPSIQNTIETAIDKTLTMLNAHYTEQVPGDSIAAQAGARLRQLVRKDTSQSEYEQLTKNMGDFNPFQTAADWAESTYRLKPPPSLRAISSQLARVSSTMSLRFLDTGTALLNLSGLVANAPSVVTALRKLPNETREEWLDRTAAWGSNIAQDVVTFSPMKAMTNAAHAVWSGELAAPLERAAKLGYFDPEYSAIAKVFAEPVGSNLGKYEQFLKYSTYMADHSETFSRKIAWGMGYKIGKELHGFENDRDAFMFANNFLNDMIGNYAPKNKPGMFQGAIGTPLGAFQTYMFNYYRRVFGYIERKDIRSVVATYATQASLFGAGGVPGWGALNNFMFSNYDGSDSMTTRLNRQLPGGMSELVLHGSLSSIPAIFGEGGLAFYTRGSNDWTALPPTIADVNRAPPFQFMAQTWNGITGTVRNILGPGKFSLQQQEQILANATTNRMIKSVMELAANAKVDRRAQLIEYGTRDAIHIAADLLGTQPSRTKALMDAYNNQKAVEATQAELRQDLNDKTRALIRGGELTVDDLQDLAQNYQHSGGNPAYFGQWLRNTMQTAVTPRTQTMLKSLQGSQRYTEFLNVLSAMQHN